MKFETLETELSSDPLTVFERLASQHDTCYLLETLGDDTKPESSGQSYIGVAPAQTLTARGNKFYVDDSSIDVENPFDSLRPYLKTDPKLPAGYVGGLVGYVSHEAVRYSEPTIRLDYIRDFPDFQFGCYDDGLIFQRNQTPRYFHLGSNRLELYRNPARAKPRKLRIEFRKAQLDRQQYTAIVDSACEDIQNGRVFQVVLANSYDYGFAGDLLELYKELRRINPSPFMFFLKFGSIITLGASPEMLLHVNRERRVSLEALAGTIRRGETAAEDKRLAETLLADPKELAEHSMLVDLARNDLGRVSKIGSVRIDDLMYIKRLSHVQHISSIVSGALSKQYDALDALLASSPPGTLCGTPKIEAIKMIGELEKQERGPYGGTVGYFSYSGDSLHAVNIRSVSAAGAQLRMHSGSGIVYDSRAANEYQEIAHKKAAMDRAMQPFLKVPTQ